MLSASSIDGRPFVDIGPSDNVAWDQPRVTVQFLTQDFPDGSDPPSNIIVGPNTFNNWLLDTGANTTLVFQTAVTDMKEFDPKYQTNGVYAEIGVGGVSIYDISIPYRFDFSDSTDFERNKLLNTSVISNPNNDISIFGPWGITGMSAMSERVTTLDFTPWTTLTDFDLFMMTDFSDELPTPSGPRYSISVDNRVNFAAEDGLLEGPNLPMWSDIPFLTGELKNNESIASGNFLFDTGAQVSILSSAMAFNLGLDTNEDGVLDELDANFARVETIGGISGTETVPVFLIDEVHIQTDQGSDLVWTDLQWVILDIVEGIDGVFGFDNMTSGWIEAFGVDGQSGYIMKSHLDFRGWETTGEGKIYFDVNPDLHTRVDPNGPGAVLVESGGITAISENGYTDTYQIRLSQPPAANVTVSFVGSANQAIAYDSLNPANQFVVFTPQNWDVPQTVVVAAVNDSVAEGYHRVFMRNVASSADPNYDNVGMPRLSVSIIDDDFAGVMLLPTASETIVSESGTVDYYDIVLAKAPVQPVSIVLEHVAQQILAVNNVDNSDTINFTPANWNVPQRVRVTAIDDPFTEGTHPAYITHRISTTDADYQQAFVLQERVTIIDNDGETTPPTITGVWATSAAWSTQFVDAIDGGGMEAGNGIGIEMNPASQPLPWNNVNRFIVQFSEDVQFVGPGTLEVRNSAGIVPSTITYDSVTHQAVVQVSNVNAMTKLRLAVSDAVTDLAGNSLDGDNSNGAGGIFDLRINVLPADSNGDGRVQGNDLPAFAGAFNTQPGDATYNARTDWNGVPRVNGLDIPIFAAMFNKNLADLNEPGSPFGGGGGGGGGGTGGIANGFEWQSTAQSPVTASAWLTTPYISWDGKTVGQWDAQIVNEANPFLAGALRRRDALLKNSGSRNSDNNPVDDDTFRVQMQYTMDVEQAASLRSVKAERPDSETNGAVDAAILQLGELAPLVTETQASCVSGAKTIDWQPQPSDRSAIDDDRKPDGVEIEWEAGF